METTQTDKLETVKESDQSGDDSGESEESGESGENGESGESGDSQVTKRDEIAKDDNKEVKGRIKDVFGQEKVHKCTF